MTVLHQPRVAWDGARAFVRAPMSLYFEVFAQQVRDELGPEMLEALEDTYVRIVDNYWQTGGDQYVPNVEAGKWRVRLEDLLRTRPDLAPAVAALARSI